MPKIYYKRLGRLGNNIIQYMTARIFNIVFGHELVPYASMCKDAREIHDNDELFEAMKEYILGTDNYKDILKSHPFANRDIILNGYFQQSELLLFFRSELRCMFTESNETFINNEVRVCDIVKTKGCANPDEIVVHLRLDDFQEETISHVLHPRVYLQELRKLSSPIRIVSEVPRKFSEELYHAVFENIRPIFQSKSVLEDFATLRDATTLFSSNSTFSWVAAFLGEQKRYLPEINSWGNQNLQKIEDSDIQLTTTYIPLHKYQEPIKFLPLAGEQFQMLCDVSILTKEKEVYHKQLEDFVSHEKRLFLEEEWDLQNPLRKSKKVFLYQEFVELHIERLCTYFENIQLLVIHNGDTCVPLNSLTVFLNKFPNAFIYLQNNIYDHPRIYSLPMGVENKMWRIRETYYFFEKCFDINGKSDLAVCSWFSNTHAVRKGLRSHLEECPFDGLRYLSYVTPDQYDAYLRRAIYSFCPPGNAYDTHRLWETIYATTIPIVLRDDFIMQLQKTYPSLPLFVVDSFFQDSYKESLEQRMKENPVIKFPLCLLFEYWILLFETY